MFCPRKKLSWVWCVYCSISMNLLTGRLPYNNSKDTEDSTLLEILSWIGSSIQHCSMDAQAYRHKPGHLSYTGCQCSQVPGIFSEEQLGLASMFLLCCKTEPGMWLIINSKAGMFSLTLWSTWRWSVSCYGFLATTSSLLSFSKLPSVSGLYMKRACYSKAERKGIFGGRSTPSWPSATENVWCPIQT